MGTGLSIAGLTLPAVSYGLFDQSVWFTGRSAAFKPDLAITFGSALIAHCALFWGVARQMTKPVLSDQFCTPKNTIIDTQLLGGALLFGLGWALSTHFGLFFLSFFPVFALDELCVAWRKKRHFSRPIWPTLRRASSIQI